MFLSGDGIIGIEMASCFSGGWLLQFEHTTKVSLAAFRILLLNGHCLAPFDAGLIEHPSRRAVSSMIPASASANARANESGFADLRLVAAAQIAFSIEPLIPVDGVCHGPGVDEFPICTVEHPGVAALVGIDDELPHHTLDRQVYPDELKTLSPNP